MAKAIKIQAVFKGVDKVTRPMGRMQQSVQRFTRSARRGLMRLDRVTSSVARGLGRGLVSGITIGAAAVTGLLLAVNKLADSLDSLAKQSKRLEFPIEDLQEWGFVAEQAGLSSEVFNKSLDKFAKTIGEAKNGYGALTTALRKIDPGLLKQLKRTKDVGEAFDLYIKAIRKIPDVSTRAALATAAFGRSGMKMMNIAKLSQKEISALREEMRKNGVATMEQAEAAEAYNDSMNSLKRAVGGFIITALAPLLPYLTKAAKFVREWALANKDVIKSKIVSFGRKIVDNWSSIVKWAKRIGKGVAVFLALTLALKGLIGVLTVVNALMAANPIGLIVIGVAAGIAAIVAFIVHAEKIKKWIDDLPAPIKVLAVVLQPLLMLFHAFAEAAVFIKKNWGPIKDFMSSTWKGIIEAATAAPSVIENTWSSISTFFTDLWTGIVGTFESAINYMMHNGPISWIVASVALIKRNWGTIVPFFESLWATAMKPFKWAFDTVMSLWTPIVGFFKSIFGSVGKSIEEGLVKTGALGWIIGAVDQIKKKWAPISGFFSSIWSGITSIFNAHVAAIKTIVGPIMSIVDKISKAKSALIDEEFGKFEVSGAQGGEQGGDRQLITSDDRIAKSVSESLTETRSSSKSEVTLKLPPGVEVESTSGSMAGLSLAAATGGF